MAALSPFTLGASKSLGSSLEGRGEQHARMTKSNGARRSTTRKNRHGAEDGTHRANAEQVHALIEEARIAIFKKHELGTQPPWEEFEHRSANTYMQPVSVLSTSSMVKGCNVPVFFLNKRRVVQEQTGGWLRNCKSRCSFLINWKRCQTWLRRHARIGIIIRD